MQPIDRATGSSTSLSLLEVHGPSLRHAFHPTHFPMNSSDTIFICQSQTNSSDIYIHSSNKMKNFKFTRHISSELWSIRPTNLSYKCHSTNFIRHIRHIHHTHVRQIRPTYKSDKFVRPIHASRLFDTFVRRIHPTYSSDTLVRQIHLKFLSYKFFRRIRPKIIFNPTNSCVIFIIQIHPTNARHILTC